MLEDGVVSRHRIMNNYFSGAPVGESRRSGDIDQPSLAAGQPSAVLARAMDTPFLRHHSRQWRSELVDLQYLRAM